MKKIIYFILVFLFLMITGCKETPQLSYDLYFDAIEAELNESIPNVINSNVNLITENYNYGAIISWKSSKEEILSSKGEFKNDTLETFDVILSYIIEIKGITKEGQIEVKVEPSELNLKFNDIEKIIRSKIPTSTNKDLELMYEYYKYSAKITWESSNENVISSKGVVTNYDTNPVSVILTYTINIDNEQRTGNIDVEVLNTEDYIFELDKKEVYIGINHSIELYGVLYKKGEVYSKVTSEIKIDGEYDRKTPGKYELVAYVERNVNKFDETGNVILEKKKFTYDFTLYVLEEIKVVYQEINVPAINSVEYSFGINNYYIVCIEGKMHIIDLNNPNQYKTVEITGRCTSYYYKDGYLYISSVEPYEDIYSDNFTGYIYKIDIENGIKIEEIEVNSAPDSIVVDKRNNVIISKEQNQHVSIDYLDMNTKTISTLCMAYAGDKLVYNENEDELLIISTFTTADPRVYKYNEQNKGYEDTEKEYTLPMSNSPTFYGRFNNIFIFGANLGKKYYTEFINGELIMKVIPFPYEFKIFNANHNVSITKDSFAVVQHLPNNCYITIYDKVLNEYKVYLVTNFGNNDIDSIHLYNNNIYMLDNISGKLLVIAK